MRKKEKSSGNKKGSVIAQKETVRVVRKVIYLYEDGTPVKDAEGNDAVTLQWADFVRNKEVDTKSGKAFFEPWATVTFEALETIFVPGYETKTKLIPVIRDVSPENPPSDVKVVFFRIPDIVDLYEKQWTFLHEGKPDYSHTGLERSVDGNLVYVEKGILKKDHTGLVEGKDKKWYYVKNGIFDNTYTGIAKSTNGKLYFVKNGMWNISYTGLAPAADGKWYYVRKGGHMPGYTGVAKSTNNQLYFVSNGVWTTSYTGLAQNEDGKWYFMKNGKYDPGYTGVARSTNGKLYYVKKGLWDTTFTGTVKDSDGLTYNVKNGRI